ncbi:TetR family transcriptional regulator [Rhizobium sp. PP-F2F-G38]|nr:TetR family transcriptional regulator [Rhizobium sp. PP-WC-1G-195]PYE39547.1 TetR family transcriptional regulator [Rhizobium sp. PP-F2F-G20b]PYE93290.1 TetR family transcriptional regulator [Rhizobium sp. PP-F2F-G38]TCL89400.1 TetR family transcriptional regulator [Rhizobium sp. PP-WC-2G-219]TCQ01526.1 TetR family transcriptional regulator [Rhizobium sp. PP-F2F-G36]
MTTELPRSRGRPRRFEADQAVATAQDLFHARGYDGLSVSDVTEALGINPPSFYAAFGSKVGLYAKVLDRYAATNAIPLQDLLRSDRPVAECLASLLEEAARRYASNSATLGCMVLEGTRSNDMAAREAACVFHTAAEQMIRAYIAARHPDQAERWSDFVVTTMAGLSARARMGQSLDRLLATAHLAGSVLTSSMPSTSED